MCGEAVEHQRWRSGVEPRSYLALRRKKGLLIRRTEVRSQGPQGISAAKNTAEHDAAFQTGET